MDSPPQTATGSSIVVTGLGAELSSACDATPFLKTPKHRKFMGPQDHLAVCAAGRALVSAGLDPGALRENAGLFLAVGFIPFERADINTLMDGSIEGGSFSMPRFAGAGYAAVNPLLTFRCLPNMPAYHVSANFDVRGEYFVTYPGVAQFYMALEEAVSALESGRVSIALTGGVAHQTNFLVTQHHARFRRPVEAAALVDAAGFVVLETAAGADARRAAVRARLYESKLRYTSHDPFAEPWDQHEEFSHAALPGQCGAASLAVALSSAKTGRWQHRFRSRDGFTGASDWEIS